MSTYKETMQSAKTKVEDFFKSHRNCKDFPNDLLEDEEDKIKGKMEKYNKEELIEKSKQ